MLTLLFTVLERLTWIEEDMRPKPCKYQQKYLNKLIKKCQHINSQLIQMDKNSMEI